MPSEAELERESLPHETSLHGRTVMITRDCAQADEFARALASYDARVITSPPIEITDADDYAPLDEAISNLYGYDWIIFTSRNAAERFFNRLQTHGITADELDSLKVCAIGGATANCLRDMEAHVDVVPMRANAEAVFQSLADYAGGAAQLSGLNFLLPRAAQAHNELPRLLEAAGARCDAVSLYQTMLPATTERARIHALLAGGAIDCIAFTSSSSVQNFALVFEKDDLSELLRDVRVACMDDATCETARRFRLTVDIETIKANTTALASQIALYFAARIN